MEEYKITEDIINYNVLRMISDIIGNPWDYIDENGATKEELVRNVGAVFGVLMLADELKKWLPANSPEQ